MSVEAAHIQAPAVPWQHPDHERMFWTHDRMHFPQQVARMESDFIDALYAGMNAGAELYELPIRARAAVYFTRHYLAIGPLPLSPEELDELGRRSEEKLGAGMAQLRRRWDDEHLPEIKRYLMDWQEFDPRRASTEELLAHWDLTRERLYRLTDIHFQIAFPMLLSLGLFDEIYTELFAAGSSLESMRLLQGIENSTTEMGREIWRLSRLALANPSVRSILEQHASADVIPALAAAPECAGYLAELRTFLGRYGHRCETWGVSFPSWIEDPSPVAKTLKDYLAQPERDLKAEMESLAAERERITAEARERLAGYPEQVRGQFEFLLGAARNGHYLSEEHGFWIDFYSVDMVRQVILEIARRLVAAGVIAERDDVFHLSFDEMRAALAGGGDLHGLVTERKAELERYRTFQAPPVLGTEPPGPPPDNPLFRTIGKFFGGPPRPPSEPGVFNGTPGSAGLVRGTARVIRSIADAARLQPGDILVTEATTPSWTPLFASAAAVVTDAGGVLSHCAVVAREYMIPAVVGLGMGTALIPDGATIEVDGTAGIVRVLAG